METTENSCLKEALTIPLWNYSQIGELRELSRPLLVLKSSNTEKTALTTPLSNSNILFLLLRRNINLFFQWGQSQRKQKSLHRKDDEKLERETIPKNTWVCLLGQKDLRREEIYYRDYSFLSRSVCSLHHWRITRMLDVTGPLLYLLIFAQHTVVMY